ncbi:MAG: hypothetical protein KC925_01195 [Candidatus Doudnabacteria bacterium]|nr:hypothetical protein [Candidatus Doudnabacteria bacterium]
MSAADIEVELRAPLTRDDVVRINAYLEQNGATLKEDRERTNYLYDCDDFSSGRDLRVKETNGVTKLSLKIGGWGDVDREEIEWELGEGETQKALRFLAATGCVSGKSSQQHAMIWDYKGYELAVVEWNGGDMNYLEIESIYPLGATEEQREQLHEAMRAVFKELEVNEFTTEAYEAFLDEMSGKGVVFSVESPLRPQS